MFALRSVGGREREVIEELETTGDTAALEQDSATRDFGWMCGKDGRNLDLVEGLGQGFGG